MEKIYSSDNKAIIISISEDAFSAYCTINDHGVFQSEADLIQLIEDSGIVYGFENAQNYNQANNLSKEFGEPFLIALGNSYEEANVEFIPVFDTENCFNPLTFNNQFQLLNDFHFVEAGENLAQLFITSDGSSGKNVFGEEVSPESNNEVTLLRHIGENVYYSEEKSMIIAEQAGYPYLDDDQKIHIKSNFEINEDVGLNFDNFKLQGNLTIYGNVHEKITMNIIGNLIVNGDINDAKLEVSGKVIVNGDILNCRETGIVAKGDVSFNSAESARVVTSGKIEFKENAHFCRLIADQGIFGDEKSGSIIGGLVQSGENIEVAVIGNSGAIGTEVEVTISPYVKEKMLVLTKEMMKMRDKPELSAKFDKLSQEMEMLEEKLEEDINTALLSDNQIPRHITVMKKIFGGTYLRVLKKSVTISEEIERVSFSIVNGELYTDQFA
jgi:uncharacterized protein (DUF342 family)